MKRWISFALTLVLLFGLVPKASAEEEIVYGKLPVWFASNAAQDVYLKAMYANGHVYCDANELGEYLGYSVKNGTKAVILEGPGINGLPGGSTMFVYDSTEVVRSLSGWYFDGYEAPCPAVKNPEGVWIPLDYAVKLMGGDLMITGDFVLIQEPTEKLADIFGMCMQHPDQWYMFDWIEDLGLSQEELSELGSAAHAVTLFNGCITGDGDSWSVLFSMGSNPDAAYDAAFCRQLGLLLCTDSVDELTSGAKTYAIAGDLLSDESLVILANKMKQDINEVVMADLADDILEDNSNSGLSKRISACAKKAVQLENDELDLRMALEDYAVVSGGLKALSLGLEFANYVCEYAGRDMFAIDALTAYLDAYGTDSQLPNESVQALAESAKDLQGNIWEYSASKLLTSKTKEAVSDGVKNFLGTPANAMLVAWDITSNLIPYFADGLSETQQFLLSMYAWILQTDTYIALMDTEAALLSCELSADSLTNYAKACYLFLKSCYLNRQAALAVISSELTDTQIQAQEWINLEIAGLLSILKTADGENENYEMGFLPADNRNYLAVCDDTDLAKRIIAEPYASYLKIIAEAEEKYGEITAVADDSSSLWDFYILEGVAYMQALDFDADGTDELLLVRSDGDFEWDILVYGYDTAASKTVLLHRGDASTGGGVGARFLITEYDGKIYLKEGHMGYNADYTYYTVSNGAFIKARHVRYDEDTPGGKVYVDGKQVSAALQQAEESLWNQNLQVYELFNEGMDDYIRYATHNADEKQRMLEKAHIFPEE